MAAEVNVRRSSRIESFGIERPVVETRKSPRIARFGLLKQQQCNILLKILSCLRERELLMQNAMSLRATCKEIRAKIDDHTEFGLPFLKLLGVNFHCDPWQNAFKNKHWLSVCKDWVETPLKVVALDYSRSMDEPNAEGGPTHLKVALEILSNIFVEQQQTLRGDMILYVFAKDFIKFRIRNPERFSKLIDEMNTEGFTIERQETVTKKVIESLITSRNSPLNRNELIKKVSIEMISDHDFEETDVATLIETLRRGALNPTNKNREFILNFVPTSEKDLYQNTWQIASEELLKARRKRNVQINLNTTHSAKRVRIDLEEQE